MNVDILKSVAQKIENGRLHEKVHFQFYYASLQMFYMLCSCSMRRSVIILYVYEVLRYQLSVYTSTSLLGFLVK